LGQIRRKVGIGRGYHPAGMCLTSFLLETRLGEL
jgi:hypothetical protein